MVGFTYKSYNFIDKDPMIDDVRSIYLASGVNYHWIEDASGVKASTLRNWFEGKTKRPQAATVNAVLRALGYRLEMVPFTQIVRVEPPLPQPKPRDTSVRHVVQMAKFRRGKHG